MADGAFDTANYPTVEPETLRRGDRWAWKRVDLGTTYAPASYALTYEAVRLDATQYGFTLTASESGTEYRIEIGSSTTAGYPAGTYRWRAFLTRSSDSERIEVGHGTWLVEANPATDRADPRSFNERMLDAIRATIEGRATQDHSSYSIAGRALTRLSPDELQRWMGVYEHRVSAERNTERHRHGRQGVTSIQARF